MNFGQGRDLEFVHPFHIFQYIFTIVAKDPFQKDNSIHKTTKLACLHLILDKRQDIGGFLTPVLPNLTQ
jgi:hypothetical protein